MQINQDNPHTYDTRSIDPYRWVIKYADYLYAFAKMRVNSNDQARDLVQDTFLAALEGVNKFEGRCSEKTWLTCILKNKVIDVYRKKSSRQITIDTMKLEQEYMKFYDTSNGRWTVPYCRLTTDKYASDPLVIKELADALRRSIHKLPALWSSIFSMKYMDDKSTKDICKELKVSPSKVWTAIHRSKNSLRASLQKLDY